MIAAFEHNALGVTAGRQQCRLHAFGLLHQMREVLIAVSDKKRWRLMLDTIDRAGALLVTRRAEETRACAQAGLRSEIVHARNRQAAADHIAGQAGAGLPVAAHRKQGGVVSAC